MSNLSKTYNSVFDSLYQKTNSNNPFASIFTEADRAAKDFRENLRGLSPELQAIAEKLQQKLTADSPFNARLDTALEIFDLRDSADTIRSPFKDDLQKFNNDPAKSFSDFLESGLKQLKTG